MISDVSGEKKAKYDNNSQIINMMLWICDELKLSSSFKKVSVGKSFATNKDLATVMNKELFNSFGYKSLKKDKISDSDFFLLSARVWVFLKTLTMTGMWTVKEMHMVWKEMPLENSEITSWEVINSDDLSYNSHDLLAAIKGSPRLVLGTVYYDISYFKSNLKIKFIKNYKIFN